MRQAVDQTGQAGGEVDTALLPGPLNQVRLALSLLACNLGNLWRRRLPTGIENWSLTSLQQRVVKTGGRLMKARALPLAIAGGRTSEPAAARGGAGNFDSAGADLRALGSGSYENCFTLPANSGTGVELTPFLNPKRGFR